MSLNGGDIDNRRYGRKKKAPLHRTCTPAPAPVLLQLLVGRERQVPLPLDLPNFPPSPLPLSVSPPVSPWVVPSMLLHCLYLPASPRLKSSGTDPVLSKSTREFPGAPWTSCWPQARSCLQVPRPLDFSQDTLGRSYHLHISRSRSHPDSPYCLLSHLSHGRVVFARLATSICALCAPGNLILLPSPCSHILSLLFFSPPSPHSQSNPGMPDFIPSVSSAVFPDRTSFRVSRCRCRS